MLFHHSMFHMIPPLYEQLLKLFVSTLLQLEPLQSSVHSWESSVEKQQQKNTLCQIKKSHLSAVLSTTVFHMGCVLRYTPLLFDLPTNLNVKLLDKEGVSAFLVQGELQIKRTKTVAHTYTNLGILFSSFLQVNILISSPFVLLMLDCLCTKTVFFLAVTN